MQTDWLGEIVWLVEENLLIVVTSEETVEWCATLV